VYEDETSQTHGLPLWLSRANHAGIIWDVREKIDHAQAAIAEYDAAMEKQKNPPRGISRYVVAVDANTGEELALSGLKREELFKTALVESSAETEQTLELIQEGLIDLKPAGGWDPREYGDGLIESASSG
jgi:hypothetical protein